MMRQSIWEFWAKRYERLWVQRAILEPTRRLVHRRMVELEIVPGRLLDVGCGIGQFAAEIAACYPACNVVGCDTSPRMVEKARAAVLPDRVSIRLGSLETVERESPFDVIVCMHVLPYLPDKASALRTMGSRLKPEGRLFIVHANGLTAYDRLLLAGAKRLVSQADYLPPEAVGRLLEQAGLAVRNVTRLPVSVWLPSIHLVEASLRGTSIKP